MDDLFPSDKLPEQPPFFEGRMNRKQLMEDKAFYTELLREVYNAGPMGLPMRTLIARGKNAGWWQDTVDKHFGEKMRAAWAYGLVVVPDYPGSDGTDGKRIVHPAFFTVKFEKPWLQDNWNRLLVALNTFNFMPK